MMFASRNGVTGTFIRQLLGRPITRKAFNSTYIPGRWRKARLQRLTVRRIGNGSSCKLLQSFIYSQLPSFTCLDVSSSTYTGESMERLLSEEEKTLLNTILTPELRRVVQAFEKEGFEIRIVGGAVRDLLLGKETPKDVDLGTDATPEEMVNVLTKHKIKLIETGLQHGTITAHINEMDFEVTTLRIDVETDGRHAKVQFTKNWRLDAERRDLTFNAMSLSTDGTIYDYFNGIEDLRNKHVRFVGDPKTRISEDFLRILRYFRFYGRIAEKEGDHNPETLKTIKLMASGLKNIAVERIWMEVSKILTGAYAPHLLSLMYQLNVAESIGLPKVSDERLKEFGSIWERMQGCNPQPVTLLIVLVKSADDAEQLMKHWKLSNAERALGKFIASHRATPEGSPLKTYQDILVNVSNPKQLETTRSHVIELLYYKGKKDYATTTKDWPVPSFPVSGTDLKSMGIQPGPSLGKILKNLKTSWIDSYYTLEKSELLEQASKNS